MKEEIVNFASKLVKFSVYSTWKDRNSVINQTNCDNKQFNS